MNQLGFPTTNSFSRNKLVAWQYWLEIENFHRYSIRYLIEYIEFHNTDGRLTRPSVPSDVIPVCIWLGYEWSCIGLTYSDTHARVGSAIRQCVAYMLVCYTWGTDFSCITKCWWIRRKVSTFINKALHPLIRKVESTRSRCTPWEKGLETLCTPHASQDAIAHCCCCRCCGAFSSFIAV